MEKTMTGFLGLRPTRYALFCTVMKHNTRNIRAQKRIQWKRTDGHDNYNQALENHEVIQGHLTVLGVNAKRYIVPKLQSMLKQLRE